MYVDTNPISNLIVCLNKYDHPAVLNTIKSENNDKENKTPHIILSPSNLIFEKILFNSYNDLTCCLNCKPLSSKFSNKSKLAHEGDNKTTSPLLAIL